MRWLIAHVPNGATVLDPFAGSGTTGIAAASMGRDVVLIERDAEYARIATQRLLHHDPDGRVVDMLES